MKTLSREDETRILSAVEKTAELVNDGLTPNDAIVKAASGLRPGHVTLVVHAYNTGRTTHQRQLGDDPLEKAADFPMADAAKILEQLYPSQVKTAAQVQRETVVSTEYAVSPGGMLARQRRREKAAASKELDLRLVNTPPPPPPEPTGAVKRAHSRAVANRRTAEESRRQVSAAFDKLGVAFTKLGTYFRTPGHISFGDVQDYAESLHGAAGKAVLKQLLVVDPHLRKQAATDRTHSAHAVPYQLLADVLDRVAEHRQLKLAHDKRTVELARDTEETLLPFVAPPSSVLGFSTKTAFLGGLNPNTNPVTGGYLKGFIDKTVGQMSAPDSDDRLVQQQVKSLTDPQHEAALRNIRTQAMLQDLMMNDPVISGYDQEDALGAFNEIGEIAPRAVDQRLIMQTLMRKRLEQGQLDTFEADQLLGMEGKLKKRDEVTDDNAVGSVL